MDLALAEVPTAQDEELPLDELVQISSQTCSTRFSMTNPVFRRDVNFESSDECAEDDDMMFGAPESVNADPPAQSAVAVLQEAKVGPYDAQLIEAESGASSLNGSMSRATSRIQKASHSSTSTSRRAQVPGHQTSKRSGLRRHRANRAHDERAGACVPLKLTSIAATPEMLSWCAPRATVVRSRRTSSMRWSTSKRSPTPAPKLHRRHRSR